MNMPTQNTYYPVHVAMVGVPRGAASRWAWATEAATARVVIERDGIAVAVELKRTGRILSWRSKNYSSQGQRIYDEFAAVWSGAWVSAADVRAAAESRQRRLACWVLGEESGLAARAHRRAIAKARGVAA